MNDDASSTSTEDVPAAATYRLKPTAVLRTFIIGALVASFSVWLLGRVPTLVGALVFGAGLAGMMMAWIHYRYRITFNAHGITVPRRPSIPWDSVTGCQVHMLAGFGGFEIESTGPQGNVQRIFVSRRLEDYRGAFRTFLAMADQHEAPWGISESFAAIRDATQAEP